MREKATPDRLLEVGVINGPHGLKGALTIHSHTRPAIGIAGYSFWYLGEDAESTKSYTVRRCWQHGKGMLAELDGINDRNATEALKGMRIFITQDAVDVARDEYLWEELTGCAVFTDTGELLGEVAALEEYGAQDILTVRTPPKAKAQGEWMLPFVEDVIADVDLEQRRITVHLPEGMDACFTPRF
ncbi:MAG: ribosome maturation factor RimM [Mariprofundaceae bacterium]